MLSDAPIYTEQELYSAWSSSKHEAIDSRPVEKGCRVLWKTETYIFLNDSSRRFLRTESSRSWTEPKPEFVGVSSSSVSNFVGCSIVQK